MELALLETATSQVLYNQQRHFLLSPPFLATGGDKLSGGARVWLRTRRLSQEC